MPPATHVKYLTIQEHLTSKEYLTSKEHLTSNEHMTSKEYLTSKEYSKHRRAWSRPRASAAPERASNLSSIEEEEDQDFTQEQQAVEQQGVGGHDPACNLPAVCCMWG